MWKFWPFGKKKQAPAAEPQAAPPPAKKPRRLSQSSNAFAVDLWGELRKTEPGNLALSPASITLALAMTWGGARGKTAAEMKQVLHLEGTPEDILGSAGKLLQAWNSGTGSTLRVVNRLFGEQSYAFEAPYLELTRSAFGAELEPVDFATQAEQARGFINAWVAKQTGERIQNLIPARGVSGGTRLALVNAIYFEATWAKPFQEDFTRDEPFFLEPGTQKHVPMMHGKDSYRFATVDGVRLLELPYEAGDTAMVFVLPEAVDGLDAVEQSLTSAQLERWLAAMEYETVRVALPRCEIAPPRSLALANALGKLGMQRTFSPEADFTGIARPPKPGDELLLSEVFHKAFVRIDELGTKAAAGTAVTMEEGAVLRKEQPREFRADHPFLFFLRDTQSGMLLFMGRVVDPSL